MCTNTVNSVAPDVPKSATKGEQYYRECSFSIDLWEWGSISWGGGGGGSSKRGGLNGAFMVLSLSNSHKITICEKMCHYIRTWLYKHLSENAKIYMKLVRVDRPIVIDSDGEHRNIHWMQALRTCKKHSFFTSISAHEMTKLIISILRK